ncbi:MAG: hypothetical protein ISS28_07815 [Candidatus Cloacimonetes bacterium]|nr:hypothetical protein [Candidatus Cloacimonadota bacterium]MBL7086983.1 hypothetical protein [Candidatus Cloacimonadota bacterium]
MIKIKAAITIITLLFCVMSLFGDDYFPGKLNIKVQTPFTSIEKVNGIIETEQDWFNQLAGEINYLTEK